MECIFLKYAIQKEESSSLTNDTLEKYDETISIQVDEFEFNQIGTLEYNIFVKLKMV